MARIDYGGLAKAVKAVIEADPNVRGYGPTVELNPGTVALDKFPHVGVYERPRRVLGGQPIAAGQRTRFGLRWEVIVSAFGKDFDAASQIRDEILGYVELALMASRTLGGALVGGSLELGGGELTGGPTDTGFISQGSVALTAEATASTV